MRFVEASGSAHERGRTMGLAFADVIDGTLEFNRGYVTSRGIDASDLERLLAPYLAASRDAFPELVELLQGVADGADRPFDEVFLANAFEEVYGILELETPAPAGLERCTDVALRGPGCTLLAHDEQWYAGEEGAVGMVLDVPDDGPALLAPMLAGEVALVGMNEHGLAVGAMSLSGRDERQGIPRALVARDVLNARDRADAIARATRASRAGGYSYLMVLPGGDAFVVESTATASAVLERITHTNHALDPSVAAAAFEPSEGSLSRLARAEQLAPQADVTVEAALALLADHDADGMDICCHPDPSDGAEGSTILFAMVCDVERREMWVTDGHPCTAPAERFAI